jgi:hypothetical protein
MAPIKFEENIKDKLEKRTIQPSIGAWDKLSADLNRNDKKNRKGLIFYIGIAASLTAILLVTTVMFNTSEGQLGDPTIVETAPETIENNVEFKDVNQAIEQETLVGVSEEKKDEKEIKHIKSSIKNEPVLATISNQPIKKDVNNKVKKSIQDELTIAKEEKQAVAILNLANDKKEQSSVSALTIEDV